MSKVALFIKHSALPGKRDELRKVWERLMRPEIVGNDAHEAYFYCYDDRDPDTVCVYQQYADREASQAFLGKPAYAAYLRESRPLLAREPEITAATPVWIKSLSA
ncbi:MAG TPA: antibiotic biosynthesis monooxygenase [Myxococcota bacterium]|nr:antibiotic biosynthesis monooxygenase [Myxococcota bacterium]